MTSTLTEAVNTDRFGGLSGYKRPLNGNPTRVPTNLPAFRGVPHRPGDKTIRAPAIRSSANKPDRKTNVLIPYARVCPLDNAHEIGRASPGDVVFLSKARPNLPGYAHSRFNRIVGIDFLNRFLGKDFWKERVLSPGGSTYSHILVDSVKVADDWRAVPFLTEWSLDGIVLSNDQPEAFYNDAEGKRDGQLFNIGIQGVCTVNNGFVDEKGVGQLAREASAIFAPGYMDHRTEMFGKNKTQNDQSYDFAAMYQGPQYHLYPLQMFDRQIRPMQELFVGLVATEVEAPVKSVIDTYDQSYNSYKRTVKDIEKAKQRREILVEKIDDPDTSATEKANTELLLTGLENRLALMLDEIADFKMATSGVEKMLKNRDIFREMGWWNDGTNEPLTDEGVPQKHFHTFKFITFSSGQLFDLDNTIDVMAPEGVPKMTKRRRLDADPYESETKREDLQRLVGAWHLGKVLDMKAAKMPYFEGGPMETGYRVSVNLNIEWWDWRRLRKTFTASPNGLQVAGLLKGPGMAKFNAEVESSKREHDLVLQWPTTFDANLYNGRPTSGDPEAAKDFYEANTNVPVNPDSFYRGNPIDKRRQRSDYLTAYYKDEIEKGATLPSQESDDPTEVVLPAIFEARAAKLPKLPPAPPLLADNDPITDGHLDQLHTHFALSVQNLKAMLAPVTPEEMSAFGGVRVTKRAKPAAATKAVEAPPSASVDSPSVANVTKVTYTPVSTTTPSSTSKNAATATVASSETPLFTNVTASVAPIVAEDPPPSPGPAEPIEAPAASPIPIESPAAAEHAGTPPSSAGRSTRRRGGAGASIASDVFSSIFGSSSEDASSAPMQPLNPAHQAGSSGGTSGRSYRRRGSGAS